MAFGLRFLVLVLVSFHGPGVLVAFGLVFVAVLGFRSAANLSASSSSSLASEATVSALFLVRGFRGAGFFGLLQSTLLLSSWHCPFFKGHDCSVAQEL